LRALLQRVSQASVSVGGGTLGRIGAGLVVLLGISSSDDVSDIDYIVDKTVNLRIFPDDQGRFDRSVLDTSSELLVISQFTLYGNTRKGRRPSFTEAAPAEQADAMFSEALDKFRASGLKIETGKFQAHMLVEISNDGPVTIMLDSSDRDKPRRG
jgi:D-tyrosyl-tRNA(Tyr) deacylase